MTQLAHLRFVVCKYFSPLRVCSCIDMCLGHLYYIGGTGGVHIFNSRNSARKCANPLKIGIEGNWLI